MADLFQTSRTNVVEHIKHIYEEKELDEASTCRNFRQVRKEGNREVNRELPFQSGQFCGTERHISKRGNKYLRKTGYELMQSLVMHKPEGDPVFEFIQKKRSEGKCGKEAMVAGLNKFLRVYYGKVSELYSSINEESLF